MAEFLSRTGTTKAVVLVKAAPQIGQKNGETVCCAGVDYNHNWLRLYPVSFRYLKDGQKFKRWDIIQFDWRIPKDDRRSESRRIDQHSIQIFKTLPKKERYAFLYPIIVTSLTKQRNIGNSFALLKSKILDFFTELKPDDVIVEEQRKFDAMRAQGDMFNSTSIIPYHACPYYFKYRYITDDGERTGTCQDWEIEATFFKWKQKYGEESALEKMCKVFGREYPNKGMLLAMGTHSRYPDVWLINGVIRLDETDQLPFDF